MQSVCMRVNKRRYYPLNLNKFGFSSIPIRSRNLFTKVIILAGNANDDHRQLLEYVKSLEVFLNRYIDLQTRIQNALFGVLISISRLTEYSHVCQMFHNIYNSVAIIGPECPINIDNLLSKICHLWHLAYSSYVSHNNPQSQNIGYLQNLTTASNLKVISKNNYVPPSTPYSMASNTNNPNLNINTLSLNMKSTLNPISPKTTMTNNLPPPLKVAVPPAGAMTSVFDKLIYSAPHASQTPLSSPGFNLLNINNNNTLMNYGNNHLSSATDNLSPGHLRDAWRSVAHDINLMLSGYMNQRRGGIIHMLGMHDLLSANSITKPPAGSFVCESVDSSTLRAVLLTKAKARRDMESQTIGRAGESQSNLGIGVVHSNDINEMNHAASLMFHVKSIGVAGGNNTSGINEENLLTPLSDVNSAVAMSNHPATAISRDANHTLSPAGGISSSVKSPNSVPHQVFLSTGSRNGAFDATIENLESNNGTSVKTQRVISPLTSFANHHNINLSAKAVSPHMNGWTSNRRKTTGGFGKSEENYSSNQFNFNLSSITQSGHHLSKVESWANRLNTTSSSNAALQQNGFPSRQNSVFDRSKLNMGVSGIRKSIGSLMVEAEQAGVLPQQHTIPRMKRSMEISYHELDGRQDQMNGVADSGHLKDTLNYQLFDDYQDRQHEKLRTSPNKVAKLLESTTHNNNHSPDNIHRKINSVYVSVPCDNPLLVTQNHTKISQQNGEITPKNSSPFVIRRGIIKTPVISSILTSNASPKRGNKFRVTNHNNTAFRAYDSEEGDNDVRQVSPSDSVSSVENDDVLIHKHYRQPSLESEWKRRLQFAVDTADLLGSPTKNKQEESIYVDENVEHFALNENAASIRSYMTSLSQSDSQKSASSVLIAEEMNYQTFKSSVNYVAHQKNSPRQNSKNKRNLIEFSGSNHTADHQTPAEPEVSCSSLSESVHSSYPHQPEIPVIKMDTEVCDNEEHNADFAPPTSSQSVQQQQQQNNNLSKAFSVTSASMNNASQINAIGNRVLVAPPKLSSSIASQSFNNQFSSSYKAANRAYSPPSQVLACNTGNNSTRQNVLDSNNSNTMFKISTSFSPPPLFNNSAAPPHPTQPRVLADLLSASTSVNNFNSVPQRTQQNVTGLNLAKPSSNQGSVTHQVLRAPPPPSSIVFSAGGVK